MTQGRNTHALMSACCLCILGWVSPEKPVVGQRSSFIGLYVGFVACRTIVYARGAPITRKLKVLTIQRTARKAIHQGVRVGNTSWRSQRNGEGYQSRTQN